MSLTDPELDLLLEMLEDDPAASVYPEVGEELVRRSRWADAARVLAGGVENDPEPAEAKARVIELLARARLELGQFEGALDALALLPSDPVEHQERARIEILALERAGRLEQARIRAARFVEVDPNDVVVTSVLERLAAPPPDLHQHAADPYFTVERAEQYVAIGRADRALRVYRKILLAHPNDRSIELRLRQLQTAPADVDDDLSAELTDPGLVPEQPERAPQPPVIDMPSPRFSTPVPVQREEVPTDVPAAPRERGPAGALAPDFVPVDDEEPTQKVDPLEVLRRLAENPAYEEEDTLIDPRLGAAFEDPSATPIGAKDRTGRR